MIQAKHCTRNSVMRCLRHAYVLLAVPLFTHADLSPVQAPEIALNHFEEKSALLDVPGARFSATLPDQSDVDSQGIDLQRSGLIGDGESDDSSRFTALLNQRTPSSLTKKSLFVLRRSAGTCYRLEKPVVLPPHTLLIGVNHPRICTGSRTSTAFEIRSSDIEIRGLEIDSAAQSDGTIEPRFLIDKASKLQLSDIQIYNSEEGVDISNSSDFILSRILINETKRHGIWISNSDHGTLTDLSFDHIGMFAITLRNQSHHISVARAQAKQNGIELLGATYDTSHNEIVDSEVDGTGDNCISITGSYTLVARNTLQNCAGNGINLYGEFNAAVGNHIKNNARRNMSNPLWRAGLAISPGFGGLAQHNVAFGNTINDDQQVPTQIYGLWISQQVYGVLGRNQVVRQASFRINGSTLLRADTAGVTAPERPNCLDSPSCKDGSVIWSPVKTFLDGVQKPSHNRIIANVINGSKEKQFFDASATTENEFIDLTLPIKSKLAEGVAGAARSNPAEDYGRIKTETKSRSAFHSVDQLVPVEFRSSFCMRSQFSGRIVPSANTDCVEVRDGSPTALELVFPVPFADGQNFYFLNTSGHSLTLTLSHSSTSSDGSLVVAPDFGVQATWNSTAARWTLH